MDISIVCVLLLFGSSSCLLLASLTRRRKMKIRQMKEWYSDKNILNHFLIITVASSDLIRINGSRTFVNDAKLLPCVDIICLRMLARHFDKKKHCEHWKPPPSSPQWSSTCRWIFEGLVHSYEHAEHPYRRSGRADWEGLVDDGGANDGELSISFNFVLIKSADYKCTQNKTYITTQLTISKSYRDI